MDLNQLYHDHQLSLMRAGAAACGVARRSYEVEASAIVRSIETLHRISGATVGNWQRTLPG